MFLKSNWKELVNTGKSFIKNGIEFYYLDVRLGIAYYNLNKYRKAVKYFEKAYKADKNNDLVKEYLYYSYIFSGREPDAEKLKKTFTDEFLKNINLNKTPFITAITLDSRIENNKDYLIKPDTGNLLTQAVRTKYSYFSAGLEQIFGQTRLYYNYGRIQKNNNLYYVDSAENIGFYQEFINQKVIQNQLYFNFSNQIKYGLNISVAVNWLHLTSKLDSLNIKDNYNNFVGAFSITKDFTNFKTGLYSSFSNLSNNIQIQPGITLTWYPLSSTNLYLYFNGSYKAEKADGNWGGNFILIPGLGFGLHNFYIEPSYTFGDIKNFTEANGLIINNDNDVISDRLDILTYGYLFKGKLNIFFKYQHYNKTNRYWINETENSITYKNNTYTFGIKWRL